MPRRNNRTKPQRYEPVDLTPTEAPGSAPRPLRPGQYPRLTGTSFKEANARRREAAIRQQNAAINGGIDWSVCLVPGCGEAAKVTDQHPQAQKRDHTIALPLCLRHLSVAYIQAIPQANDNLMVNAVSEVIERRQARQAEADDAEKKAWMARQHGEIYYLRLNGLIKVGWSREIFTRLKAYGPDVEVLCHYPALRSDETTLHRQLRPYLAKGREWYHDCKLIHDFVQEAISKHGPPTASAWWTEPKATVAGKRHGRAS